MGSTLLLLKVCFEVTISALSSEDAREPEEAEGGEQEASAGGQVKEDPVPFIFLKIFPALSEVELVLDMLTICL